MISPGSDTKPPVDSGCEVWARLARNDPTSPALLILARHHLAQADYEPALDIAQKVWSAHPHHLEAVILIGRALLGLSRRTEAVRILEPWVAELDGLAGHLGELADLLRAVELPGPARRADRAATALAGTDQAPFEPENDEPGQDDHPEIVPTETLAFLYLNQGHRDKAVEVYRQLLALDPANDRLKVKLAELAVEEAAELLTAPESGPPISEERRTGEADPAMDSAESGSSREAGEIASGRGQQETKQRLSRRLEKLKAAAQKRRAQVEAAAQ